MGNTFRTFIGRKVAVFSIEKTVNYKKLRHHKSLENHYPIEVLEEYFSLNPVPVKSDDCEPITMEMIKILPIKLLYMPKTNENITTDGTNVFLGKKWIGFWKN